MKLLSVSPAQHDHNALGTILTGWSICTAESFCSARQFLQDHAFKIVVCERDLPPHTWRDVLAEVLSTPRPPLLVVTSANADDVLWSEALNLGAYDVLAKPFESAEVIRTLDLALIHWKYQSAPIKPKVRSAAGALSS